MKNFLFTLSAILLVSCGETTQNKNTLTKSENHFGTIEKDDTKSLAAKRFSKAYIENDLASVSDLFTEDAKIMVNDSNLTFFLNFH